MTDIEKADSKKPLKAVQEKLESVKKISGLPLKYRIIAGILVLVIVGLLVQNLFIKEETAKKQRIPEVTVEVDEARRGVVRRKIDAVGTLTANQSVDLIFHVPGRIQEILVKGGAPVNEGDPLIRLDDTEYQAKVKEAQARLKFSKLEYERAKQLASLKAGPKKSLEKAEAEMLAAEAALEKAEFELESATLRAPFEGVVGLVNVSPGALVRPNDKVLSLVDLDPIKLDFNVPGTFAQAISVGQTVSLTIDGFGERKFNAKIEAVEPRVDPLTRSLPVRAVLPNKRGLLKAGLYGQVEVVAGVRRGALLIPDKALLTDEDKLFVYVIREEKLDAEKAEEVGQKKITFAIKTFVEKGINENGNLEITKGALSPGDRVVVVGHNKLSGNYGYVKIEGEEEDDDEAQQEESTKAVEEDSEGSQNQEEQKALEEKDADEAVEATAKDQDEAVAESSSEAVPGDEEQESSENLEKEESNSQAQEAELPASEPSSASSPQGDAAEASQSEGWKIAEEEDASKSHDDSAVETTQESVSETPKSESPQVEEKPADVSAEKE